MNHAPTDGGFDLADVLKDIEKRLQAETGPAGVADVIGDVLAHWFDFVALINVKDTYAQGWRCWSKATPDLRIEDLVIPLDRPSPFFQVFRSGVPADGRNIPMQEWRDHLESRGLKPPRPFVVVPITVAGRVPFLIYVDSENPPAPGRLTALLQVGNMSGWRWKE